MHFQFQIFYQIIVKDGTYLRPLLFQTQKNGDIVNLKATLV